MKLYIFYVVIASGFLLSTTACKKQTVKEEEPIITDTTTFADPIIIPADNSTGALAGKIMPETKYSLTLYNDRYSYEDYSIVNRTGVFLMNKVKAGTYTLFIQPHDSNIAPYEVIKISIDSGRTTNLGLIYLP